jgi:hypothetical protein
MIFHEADQRPTSSISGVIGKGFFDLIVSHHLGLLLQKEKKKVSHSHQPSDFEQQPCQDRQLRQRPDRTAKGSELPYTRISI